MKGTVLYSICLFHLSRIIHGNKWMLDKPNEKMEIPTKLPEVIGDAGETTITKTRDTKNLALSGRSYNNGGGYGMSFPNLETSLTTLAFLSFGAFLLSMLLNALNITGMGRRKRDAAEDFFSLDGDGVTSGDGGVYHFSQVALLALDALGFSNGENLSSCEAGRKLCNGFQNGVNGVGFMETGRTIMRKALNFLHEKTNSFGIPFQWTVLEKILTGGDECGELFPHCQQQFFRGKQKDKEKHYETRKIQLN